MFTFRSIGHYVAVIARDVVKFGAKAKTVEPEVEAITNLVYPPAVVIERAAFSALGYISDAAQKAAPVLDGMVTLTVQIAADEVNDFKALLAFFQAHGADSGVKFPRPVYVQERATPVPEK